MSTLKMRRDDFRRLVEPVMPFVVVGSAVPTLEGVRIRSDHGRVFAEAVSSRMLGMCVRRHEHVVPGFDTVIPFDELASHLGPPWDTDDTIELATTDLGTVLVEWTGGAKTGLAEYDVLDHRHFPDLQKKIAKALTVAPRSTAVWLDASQLEAFSVCAQRANNLHRAPLVFHPGANSHDQVLVICGDHFAGLAAAASNTPSQPSFTRLRVQDPPPGDPLELWTRQLSTPEGE